MLASRRWSGARWVLGWDQEQRTYYAQLYGRAPAELRPVYNEWLYTASPSESDIEYAGDYPALTIGDDEEEAASVDALVLAMAEELPPELRAQLEADRQA